MPSPRRRAYGLETEYALIYAPSIFDQRLLDARRIYDELEGLLRERGRTVTAEGHKTGIFLENGALVTFEAQTLRHGLLEMSTPECSSAWQALVWQSALDEMIVSLLPALHARLAAAGCHGRVIIGKNSTDRRGNYYGTHENYSLRMPVTGNRLVLGAILVAFELLFLLLDIPLGCLVLLASALALVIAGPPLALASLCSGVSPRAWLDDARGGLLWTRRTRATLRTLADEPVRLWCLLHKRVSRPFAGLYSRFMERTLLSTLSTDLTAFFLSRVIWCGSGSVTGDGRFALMQRADDNADLARTLGVRCLFDLKPGSPDTLWALSERRRLHVTYSDSNVSERAVALKLGVTGLLLEVLESGRRFEGVRVAHPWEALRDIADDPDLRVRVAMSDGSALTALEIQRRYWRQVRAHVPEGADEEAERILADWLDVLDRLEHAPASLADSLDWVAKRALVDRLGGPPPAPSVAASAEAVAAALRRAGVSPDGAADRIAEALPPRLRRRLAGTPWNEVARGALHALRLRKIDLKFHEVSPSGYGRRLLSTRTGGAERAHAARTAPADTRAAARARLVRAASPRATMKWDAFRDPARRVDVTLADPLDPS